MDEGKITVVVALSGGVDSAVAAAILKREGYRVIGIMLRLWAEGESRCCSSEAEWAARRTCQQLDIPFYLLNVERAFGELVVESFCETYACGRTPNPCVICNQKIKFGLLLERALSLGADRLATGHYARVREVDGSYQLLRGVDRAKEQSYALYRLGQEELRRALWPLGALRKAQVRALARRWRLPTMDRPESQEVCFVSDGDYVRFLRFRIPHAFRPGLILDQEGKKLGEHSGLPGYTVGQRRGLGVSHSHPLYVLRIDPEANVLVVGPRGSLGRRELAVEEAHLISGSPLLAPARATVQVRYRAREALATLYPLDEGRIKVVFDSPQAGVAPGQSAVFYQGEVVLGGGIIQP